MKIDELREAIDYMNNKDMIMQDDDYLRYESSLRLVTAGVDAFLKLLKG